jgi:hypothetical protein
MRKGEGDLILKEEERYNPGMAYSLKQNIENTRQSVVGSSGNCIYVSIHKHTHKSVALSLS